MERYKSELKPTWRLIAEEKPPLGAKVLFKSNHGAATLGVYYPESEWVWWCPLPSHTEEQKQMIRGNLNAQRN